MELIAEASPGSYVNPKITKSRPAPGEQVAQWVEQRIKRFPFYRLVNYLPGLLYWRIAQRCEQDLIRAVVWPDLQQCQKCVKFPFTKEVLSHQAVNFTGQLRHDEVIELLFLVNDECLTGW